MTIISAYQSRDLLGWVGAELLLRPLEPLLLWLPAAPLLWLPEPLDPPLLLREPPPPPPLLPALREPPPAPLALPPEPREPPDHV